MRVYRLGITPFATQLTGEGAKLFGGRWNEVGHPCIYTGENKALCALEYAANLPAEQIPDDLAFTTFEIPDESWVTFQINDLPADWKQTPPSASTKAWVTKQLQDRLVLKLPSVIIPSEFNFILNPLHPDFKKIRIEAVEPFTFDPRIKK